MRAPMGGRQPVVCDGESPFKPSRRGSILKPKPTIKGMFKENRVAAAVSSPYFDSSILIIIIIYSAWIGVDIDYNQKDSGVPKVVFTVGENIFAIIFFVEIILRLSAYADTMDFFRDRRLRGWNIFDLLLVTLMVVETWFIALIVNTKDFDDTEEDSGVPKLSVLRLLRLLRISRIFRMIPELGLMVKAMGAAVRSVSSTLLLSVAIMYVFSIVFTQWGLTITNKCIDDICFEVFFGTVTKSLLTMMQLLIFDDTFQLIRPAVEENPFYGSLLIVYIVVGAFLILNMLIGVICDIVGTTTQREKMAQLKQNVEDTFDQLDTEGTKLLSREQFMGPKAQYVMGELGCDAKIITDAFDLIDLDGSGTLDIQEFCTIVLKLLNPPESSDLLRTNKKLDLVYTILKNNLPVQANNNDTDSDGNQKKNQKPLKNNNEEDIPREVPMLTVSRSSASIAPSDATTTAEDDKSVKESLNVRNRNGPMNQTPSYASAWSTASFVSADLARMRSAISELESMMKTQVKAMRATEATIEQQAYQLACIPDEIRRLTQTVDGNGNALSIITNELQRFTGNVVGDITSLEENLETPE